jgi:ferredoxin
LSTWIETLWRPNAQVCFVFCPGYDRLPSSFAVWIGPSSARGCAVFPSAEFATVGGEVEAIIRRVEQNLEGKGVRVVGFYCFPPELGRPVDPPSEISLRLLAEEAGMGVMGKNRLVLHPRFGADIYLGAIALDRTITAYGHPLTFSPCQTCNLCDEICPSGAIGKNGHYDSTDCIQSRGYDPNVHCDLCRAVCPAGDEVTALESGRS